MYIFIYKNKKKTLTHLTVVYFGPHDTDHQLFLHGGRDSETAAHAYGLTLAVRIHHLHCSVQDY